MKTYIACNVALLSKTIETAIARLGVECSPSCILSLENVAGALAQRESDELAIVFFAMSSVSPETMQSLQDVCAGGLQGVKVVAVGAQLSPSTILQVIRAGAIDCLDVAYNFEQDLAEVMARVEVLAQNEASLGRLISVVGSTGGSGTSVLATNLAVVIAQRQGRCALLDLHVRGGDLAALLKCDPPYTLLSLAAKSEQVDREMFEQSLVTHESGVAILASPEPLGDYRSIRPELIGRTVSLARGMFEAVVVDLEDCEHPGQVQTLATSDAILLPMRPDIVSLYRTKKYLQFLLKSGISPDHVYVVVNRAGVPKQLELAQIQGVLGLKVAHRLPEDPATVMSSVNLGVPLVMASPQSLIAKGIVELASQLIGAAAPVVAPNWTTRQLCRAKSIAALIGGLHA